MVAILKVPKNLKSCTHNLDTANKKPLHGQQCGEHSAPRPPQACLKMAHYTACRWGILQRPVPAHTKPSNASSRGQPPTCMLMCVGFPRCGDCFVCFFASFYPQNARLYLLRLFSLQFVLSRGISSLCVCPSKGGPCVISPHASPHGSASSFGWCYGCSLERCICDRLLILRVMLSSTY